MVEFLLSNLPVVICALVGMALLGVELFMPGFGVPGVSGIVALLAGAGLLYARAGLDAALVFLLIVILLVAAALPFALRSATRGRLARSAVVLQADVPAVEAPEASEAEVPEGCEGVASTALRPSGFAELNGARLAVVSEGAFIEKGELVRVERIEGARVIVRRV